MRTVLGAAIYLWATTVNYGQQATIPANYGKLPTISGPSILNPQYNLLKSSQEIQQQNMRMIEQDMRNYELEKQKQQQALKQAYKELGVEESSGGNSFSSRVSHSYPVNNSFGKKYFDNAFNEINDMIEGRKPYSLKRAVFLSEYAYDTTLNYEQFDRQIAKLVSIIQLEMKQSKISPYDNLGKILVAFKFMADTIKVRNPATEKTIVTYPKTYDFDDFYGMQDYTKLFVTKLIKTGKGQCHSLPLLFLILCQEINADAYLAFAPEHSYVKFKDRMGNLHNIELTNQMFTTDQHVLASGYIKSPSIKSKIYMDTVSMKRTIAHTMNDLANSYVRKYGYDDFVMKCAQTVLSKEANSVHAYMHVTNYYSVLGMKIEKQYQALGIKSRELYFTNDDQLREIAMKSMYYGNILDELGYAEMPPDIYSKWLSLLKDESMRQQHLERKRLLSNMIEH